MKIVLLLVNILTSFGVRVLCSKTTSLNQVDLVATWFCWVLLLLVTLWRQKPNLTSRNCGTGYQHLSSFESLQWNLTPIAVALFTVLTLTDAVYISMPWNILFLSLLEGYLSSVIQPQMKDTASEGEISPKQASRSPRWAILNVAFYMCSAIWSSLVMTLSDLPRCNLNYLAAAAILVSCAAYLGLRNLRSFTATAYRNTPELGVDREQVSETHLCAVVLSTLTVVLLFSFSHTPNLIRLSSFCLGILQAGNIASTYRLTSEGFAALSLSVSYFAITIAANLTDQGPLALVFVAIGLAVLEMSCVYPIPRWARIGTCVVAVLMMFKYWGSDYISLTRPGLLPQDKLHPIEKLVTENRQRFSEMVQRQSKTKEAAIQEYQRRYSRPPPSGFDAWLDIAFENEFLLIDEFDALTRQLDPFNPLSPDHLNDLVNQSCLNRDHVCLHFDRYGKRSWDEGKGPAWMAKNFETWLSADPRYETMFSEFTISLSGLDEPGVSIPSDLLTFLASLDRSRTSRRSGSAPELRSIDVGGQKTFDLQTVGCDPDSPARNPYDHKNISKPGPQFWATSDEYMDVCQHPDFGALHSFFLGASTLFLVQAPLLSWHFGRPSSLHDILYPAPWYYVQDREENDRYGWNEKLDSCHWTGGTSGGQPTWDTWKQMQRQRMVLATQHAHEPHEVGILKFSETGVWEPQLIMSTDLEPLFDIEITNVRDCPEDICDAMAKAFHFPLGGRHREEARDAVNRYKYLLDMDGTGFSGRFYRLLRSNSAVIKQTVFKEWHFDWLVPWIHFIPLSIEGDEIWEIMRFLVQTSEGQRIGQDIAESSKEWHDKVLRKKDFELVTARLLLEYQRLIKER